MSPAQTPLDLADQSLTRAREKKVMHLYNDADEFNGRIVEVNGSELINFGSCSYLGLEKDPRLVEATVTAVRKYGTQFSSSRSYIASHQYKELEGIFQQLFGKPSLVVPTTSLGHISVFQALINPDDVIVLDHQAHASIQAAAQYAKGNGSKVKMIRHNNLVSLEKNILRYRQGDRKIWYCIDGVYSMYGDIAPIEKIYALADKYPQLHIYADDAHGFSWCGKNGLGSLRGRTYHHPRLYLAVSLNKAFACAGGCLIFPDEESRRRVRTVGNGLVFSGPIQPPLLGAAIACAKLHTSGAIEREQIALNEKIQHCNREIQRLDLLDVAHSDSPIFYIGVGALKIGYNLIARMIQEGFYVNMGIFPAVPVNNTGIRITINNHLSKQDITQMLECLAHHYPLVLAEENVDFSQVVKSFEYQLTTIGKFDHYSQNTSEKTSGLTLRLSHSLCPNGTAIWNDKMAHRGPIDCTTLSLIQGGLNQDNALENQWNLQYLKIFSGSDLILATLVSTGTIKSDMFSTKNISDFANRERANDKYAYTSKVLMLGTPISEGEHLYIDKTHSDWRDALDLLIKKLQQLKAENQCETIIVRDFQRIDEEVFEKLHADSFVQYRCIDSYQFNDVQSYGSDQYLQSLGKKNRYHWRKTVGKNKKYFSVDVVNKLDPEQLQNFYQLYTNVQRQSLEINTYALPLKLFQALNQSDDWEFIRITHIEDNKVAAVIINHLSDKFYTPMVIGMDYDYRHKSIYRIALDSIFNQAKALRYDKVKLGIGAGFEKRRMGAQGYPRRQFIQASDHFQLAALQSEA